MNDLISRIEALTKIKGCYQSLPLKNRKAWQEKYEGYIKAYEIIHDLPTVEPKTGRWIKSQAQNAWGMDVDCYECSKCGIKAIDHILIQDTEGLNYCPNCGAKMKKETMNKKEALTQLEIMATNATGRLGSAKSEEEKALLNKQIEALNMGIDAIRWRKPLTLLWGGTVEEPKTGHWIGTEYDGYADGHPVYDVYECSECGMEYDATDDGEITHNYCPNCGAKMERSKE